MKIAWRVAPAPTGRYRSFEPRGWPTAFYRSVDGPVAAWLYCADDYVPALVKARKHGPITIVFAKHHRPGEGNSWDRWRWKYTADSIYDAKRSAEAFLERHPEFAPPDLSFPAPLAQNSSGQITE